MSKKLEGGKRFYFLLQDSQRTRLQAESDRTGIPVAVLIRYAIDAAFTRRVPVPLDDVDELNLNPEMNTAFEPSDFEKLLSIRKRPEDPKK